MAWHGSGGGASRRRASADDEFALLPVASLPSAERGVFSQFRFFNALQSRVLPTLRGSDDNLVLQAPTGSGKTVAFELAILRMLEQRAAARRAPAGSAPAQHAMRDAKALYIAPLKSLVQEKLRDWRERLGRTMGVRVHELTGDTDEAGCATALADADVLLCTAEKLDATSRAPWHLSRSGGSSGMSFYGEVGLLLIDEVHSVGEDRGATLEAVVSRLRMLSCFPELRGAPIARLRVVAVSATIPNLRDVGDWLGCGAERGVVSFGEEYRPVQLQRVVLGYKDMRSNDFMFTKFTLQKQLFDVVTRYAENKPSLIFLATRKEAVDSAKTLAEQARARGNFFVTTDGQVQRLDRAAALAKDRDLRATVRLGIAHHSAGLEGSDRELVERLFLEGDLMVLTATTTLAVGVNLPAHLVVVCGTSRYTPSESRNVEYPATDVLQMIGRAGRPQFDESGVAVIMTRSSNEARYNALFSEGGVPLESFFATTLVEQMNAEAALLTVSSIDRAADWLTTTFLYRRMLANPTHYGLPSEVRGREDAIRAKLTMLATTAAKELAAAGMLKLQTDGRSFEATEVGVVLARSYCRWPTMQAVVAVKLAAGDSPEESVIDTVCASAELSIVRLRRGEKTGLNAFNNDAAQCRFPARDPHDRAKPRKRIDSGREKVKVIINHMLGPPPQHEGGGKVKADGAKRKKKDVPFPGECLQDERGVGAVLPRLTRMMADYYATQTVAQLDMYIASLRMTKSARQRLWYDSRLVARQLPDIGPVLSGRLAAAGFTSLAAIADADARLLEQAASKDYPFGAQLKAKVAAMMPPRVTLSSSHMPVNGGMMRVTVRLERRGEGSAPLPQPDAGARWAVLVLGSTGTQKIALRERVDLCRFKSPLECSVELPSMLGPGEAIRAFLINQQLVGCDKAITIASSESPRKGSQSRDTGARGRGSFQMSLEGAFSSTPLATAPQPDSDDRGFMRAGSFDLLGGETPTPPAPHGVRGTGAGAATPTTDSDFSVNPDRQHAQQQRRQLQQQQQQQQRQRQRPEEEPPSAPLQGRARCKCRCKNRAACRHTCCKRGLMWNDDDWDRWRRAVTDGGGKGGGGGAKKAAAGGKPKRLRLPTAPVAASPRKAARPSSAADHSFGAFALDSQRVPMHAALHPPPQPSEPLANFTQQGVVPGGAGSAIATVNTRAGRDQGSGSGTGRYECAQDARDGYPSRWGDDGSSGGVIHPVGSAMFSARDGGGRGSLDGCEDVAGYGNENADIGASSDVRNFLSDLDTPDDDGDDASGKWGGRGVFDSANGATCERAPLAPLSSAPIPTAEAQRLAAVRSRRTSFSSSASDPHSESPYFGKQWQAPMPTPTPTQTQTPWPRPSQLRQQQRDFQTAGALLSAQPRPAPAQTMPAGGYETAPTPPQQPLGSLGARQSPLQSDGPLLSPSDLSHLQTASRGAPPAPVGTNPGGTPVKPPKAPASSPEYLDPTSTSVFSLFY